MSNKCKWKDGKFVPCDENSLRKIDIEYDRCTGEYFCPKCGGFIAKPEPSVIIKKSGGTWVARYDGVDYLCTDPKHMNVVLISYPDFLDTTAQKKDYFKHADFWKPISDITITDDIAKLRPMVITGRKAECLEVLWGVDEKECLTENPVTLRTTWTNRAVVRLATVGDLS